MFLPGDHALDTNITVAKVDRLTMREESSSGNIATVVCTGSVGLSFTNMVGFKIDSLAFTSCNRNVIILPRYYLSTYSPSDPAFAVYTTCFTGTNNFINNQVAGEDAAGGAIFALGKTVLSFNGISNFINNSGRAINTFNNTVFNFNGISNFINNSAYYGGAINAFNNAVFNVVVVQSTQILTIHWDNLLY